MISDYSSCEQCEWRPLAQHPAVRDEPWADVDSGYRYSYCENCGNLTIHSYNPATGFGQVYILDVTAMALLRADSSPGAVLAYLYSDDFERNRGIGEPLFRGYLRYLDDLSTIVNRLVAAVEQANELERTSKGLAFLREALAEVARRFEASGTRAKLRVSELAPVIRLAQGGLPIERYDPDKVTRLRLLAWSCLELFGHPGLWSSLPTELAEMVEEITDHLTMLRSAQRGLEKGLRRLPTDGAVHLYVEAKFLQKVLAHRGARLTPNLASIVWRVMQELTPRVTIAESSTREFDRRAFVRLRALLEHHVLSLGYHKTGGERTHAGLIEYVDPRTGRSLQMPPFRTKIYIYETSDSPTPIAVLDEWDQAARWLLRG